MADALGDLYLAQLLLDNLSLVALEAVTDFADEFREPAYHTIHPSGVRLYWSV